MYSYGHGGNAVFEQGNENTIDLSANINPLGMPEGVADAINREIADVTRYPDNFSSKLRARIAEYERIDPDFIFCAGGASDIIFRLPRAARAKKAMVAAPTFSDYERSAVSYGCPVVRYALSPDDNFNLNAGFLDAVRREKPDLIFVCNPNNPTGKLTGTGLIEELLDCCSSFGARVVLDECFLDFADEADICTGKIFLNRCPNLIVLKAFTKIFALPGLRLGYAMCADTAFLDGLRFHGADWPVSNLAQAAGMAALTNADEFIKKTRNFVSAEREIIEQALTQLGYKIFASAANYVFLQNPYPFDLREKLDKKGFRIRSCGNYYELDGSFYRVAVSTVENNNKFLTAVTAITQTEL